MGKRIEHHWRLYSDNDDKKKALPRFISSMNVECQEIQDHYEMQCRNPSYIDPLKRAEEIGEKAKRLWYEELDRQAIEAADKAISQSLIALVEVYRTIAGTLIIEARELIELKFPANTEKLLLHEQARDCYKKVMNLSIDYGPPIVIEAVQEVERALNLYDQAAFCAKLIIGASGQA